MQPRDFKIAIVGGGIGGLACAISIAHHCPGVQIDVYEQAAEYSEIGAGVGIGVNAAKILHRWGLGKEANAISGWRNKIHRTMRRWDNGKEIITIGADFDEGEVKQLSVHRAELLDVLLQAISKTDAARLYVRKRYLKAEDTGEKVIVYFENGTSTTVDLLVGCDGIHSKIRSQFEGAGKIRYSGRIAYRGLVPLKDVEAFWPFESYAVSWLAKNKHFLVFPVSQNRTLNVVAFISKPEDELEGLKESWTSSAPREQLEEEYEGWDRTVVKIIQCMDSYPGKWRLNDRDLLSQWSYMNGKIVLLGDAAHAMLPHQGEFYIIMKGVYDSEKS
jgi:salicylate hydroxylase